MLQSKQDVELIIELKSGSEQAMQEIYKRYREVVYLTAYWELRENADAQDICQEVFIKLWVYNDRLEIKDLRSYLIGIAKNKARNLLRNNKRLTNRHESATADIHIDNQEEVEEKDAKAQEKYQQLRDALSKLPERRASIFEEIKIKGKSRQQVAEEANISENTVKKHLNLALTQIKKLFKK